jgi:hypothetical protein
MVITLASQHSHIFYGVVLIDIVSPYAVKLKQRNLALTPLNDRPLLFRGRILNERLTFIKSYHTCCLQIP